MKYDEFLGHVRHRTGLGSLTEAERATRATLETLAERLVGGEARDLAAQLPPELAHFLQPPDAGIGTKLTLDEFFETVSMREGVELKRRRSTPVSSSGSSRKRPPRARYKTFVSSFRLRSLNSLT